MITILFYLFSILAILVLFLVLCLLILWAWSNMRAKVPFVGIPLSILKDIEKELELKEGSTVYDLGCGDGRVLFYLAKNHPSSKYVGFENSPFPYLLAKSKSLWNKKVNKIDVEILRKDFFESSLSDATHIFTYLYPNIMDDLLPKLEGEVKRGTRLVSISFHFTVKREIKEIDLHRGKYQLAKKLYVYEF